MSSPPPSPLSEILENISMSRTPLKALNTSTSSLSKSPFHLSYLEKTSHTSQSSYRGSAYVTSTTGCSNELLQARIEHLERERVDLSLKIHQREEKDRSFKLKIEQLELQLKNSEQFRLDMQGIIETSRRDIAVITAQKRDLEVEFKKLQQAKAAQLAAESEGLWSKITASARELTRVEEEAKNLRIANESLSISVADLEKKLTEAESKASHDEKLIKSLTESAKQAISLKKELTSSKERYAEDLKNLQSKLEEKDVEVINMKIAFESEKSSLLEELEDSKATLADIKINAKSISSSSAVTEYLGHSESELQSTIKNLTEKLMESESKRRKLHNTLQDLRGNIRVYLRCRPFLPSDGESNADDQEGVSGCIKCNIGGTSVTMVGNGRGSGQSFTFDNVFPPTTSQQDVYKEVSELVQSSLDGYRVCIFSYGQTGSGKTHTMSGEKQGNSRGIIPRAVEQILEQAQKLKSDGWDISIATSILEIYNEEIKDLLLGYSTESVNYNGKKRGLQGQQSGSAPGGQIKISNIQGKVFVTGLVSIELSTRDAITGQQQVNSLLDHAATLRSTASTSMNEYSSRSHLLFMIDIQAQHERDPGVVLRGGLRLCDLAGSERLDRTGTLNDATRLKETVNINKSLSSLADVFIALGNKSSHVPFRNSKLTMLLQDCLSGDGKALMFVNVSPTIASSHETLCSLRFASQVSQVELGKANKQIFALPQQLVPQISGVQPQQPSQSSTQPIASRRLLTANTAIASNSSTSAVPSIGSMADVYTNSSTSTELFTQDMPLVMRSSSKASQADKLAEYISSKTIKTSHVAEAEFVEEKRELQLISGPTRVSSSKRQSVMPRSSTAPQSISSILASNSISQGGSMLLANASKGAASQGVINAASLSRAQSATQPHSSVDSDMFLLPAKRPRLNQTSTSLASSKESGGGSSRGWR